MENINFTASNELEQVLPAEAIVSKEVTETITALINQANIISKENEFTVKPYEGVDAPTIYISKTEENYRKARDRYNGLQEMKKSHFWTIGRNKAKVEETQKVLIDIIDAVDNNANATKALFNNQIKLAEFSKKLYGIGLMGIASNRIVVRAIKLRLEHASREEIVDLARRELESLVYELEKQQRLEKKIDDNQKVANEQIEHINNTIISNKKQFDIKINEVIELARQLEKKIDDNQKAANEQIEHINNTIISNKGQFDTIINEVKKTVSQQEKCVDDKLNNVKLITDAHDNRLCLLEKKSFLDSSIYKLFVGVVALGALILSLLTYLG